MFSLTQRGTLNSKDYVQQIRREENRGKTKTHTQVHGKKEAKMKSKSVGRVKSKADTKLKFSNLLDEEQDFLTKLADLDHFNFEPDFKVNGKRFKDCKVNYDCNKFDIKLGVEPKLDNYLVLLTLFSFKGIGWQSG